MPESPDPHGMVGLVVNAAESPEARSTGLILGARYTVTAADPNGFLQLELVDTALPGRVVHNEVPPQAVITGRRGPRVRLANDLLPEAIGTEDGESWWIHGHVTPEAAVLAVLLEQALTADAATAIDCVFGLDYPDTTDADDEALAVKPYRTREAKARREVSSLLDSVCHLWFAEDPANDERVSQCAPWFPGAVPYTVVDR